MPAHTISPFLTARSIAIIAGSSRQKNLAWHNLTTRLQLTHRPDQQLYFIHPHLTTHLHQRVFHDVTQVRKQIDLAIIATPLQQVLSTIDHCIALGIQSLLIIAGDYDPTSPAGIQLRRSITNKLTETDIVCHGPTTTGIIIPALQIHYSPLPLPKAGTVALLSDSDAILGELIRELHQHNVGYSLAATIDPHDTHAYSQWLDCVTNIPHCTALGLYTTQVHLLDTQGTQANSCLPIFVLQGGKRCVQHTQRTAEHAEWEHCMCVKQFSLTARFVSTCSVLPENTLLMTIGKASRPSISEHAHQHSIPLAQWSRASRDHARDQRVLELTNPLHCSSKEDLRHMPFMLAQAQLDPNIDSILIHLTPDPALDLEQLSTTLVAHRMRKPTLICCSKQLEQSLCGERLQAAGYVLTSDLEMAFTTLHTVTTLAQRKYASRSVA